MILWLRVGRLGAERARGRAAEGAIRVWALGRCGGGTKTQNTFVRASRHPRRP